MSSRISTAIASRSDVCESITWSTAASRTFICVASSSGIVGAPPGSEICPSSSISRRSLLEVPAPNSDVVGSATKPAMPEPNVDVSVFVCVSSL